MKIIAIRDDDTGKVIASATPKAELIGARARIMLPAGRSRYGEIVGLLEADQLVQDSLNQWNAATLLDEVLRRWGTRKVIETILKGSRKDDALRAMGETVTSTGLELISTEALLKAIADRISPHLEPPF